VATPEGDRPSVYPQIEPDGPVGAWIALDELDIATARACAKRATPRRGLDGRLYIDTRELGEWGCPS